jgi:hypothetical protein
LNNKYLLILIIIYYTKIMHGTIALIKKKLIQ